MNIIIEISSGCVVGLYASETQPNLTALVVDLDGAKVGKAIRTDEIQIEPLDRASDIVREALTL